MSIAAYSPSISMKLGTAAGPIFGLIDISTIDSNDICHFQLVQKNPTGLLAVSQILVMMLPDQAKKHQCSSDGCDFANIDTAKMPDADVICRAWFPNEEHGAPQWKEASISIGGAMVVAKYLQTLSGKKNTPWKIAFWSQPARTWELFEVSIEEDGFVRVLVHRTDFRPPSEVYRLANKSIAAFDLEDKAKDFLEALKQYSKPIQNEDNPDFALTVFVDRFKNIDSHPQLVPFLPIFIGETQNVVPVGRFLTDFLLRKNQETMKALYPYAALVERLRHMPEGTDIQEEVLGFLGIVRNWKQKEIFPDYPLLNASCGWTFFKDTPAEKMLTSLPKKFLTVEPGTQAIPPFGNSASGAFACAVAGSILYPEDNEGIGHYRGKTFDDEKPWGERFLGNPANGSERSVVIEKTKNGLWSIRARVLTAGRWESSWI